MQPTALIAPYACKKGATKTLLQRLFIRGCRAKAYGTVLSPMEVDGSMKLAPYLKPSSRGDG